MPCELCQSLFFFFNDTATTEIYTLSLHDALPISARIGAILAGAGAEGQAAVSEYASELGLCFQIVDDVLNATSTREELGKSAGSEDRKSTRLNSSHANISYAVFCLKKKTLTC